MSRGWSGQTYIKHPDFSGTWIVTGETNRVRKGKNVTYYIAVKNSAAFHQRIFLPAQCTEISEEEYDRGFVPAPNYREIFE